MNTTLIIMAAGIGSRFGTGIKQLAKMAPNGEIIMDFSIYDAIIQTRIQKRHKPRKCLYFLGFLYVRDF